MDFKKIEVKPYSQTKSSKWGRENWSKTNSAIGKMKELLIEKEFITQSEISTREDILFAVVKYITSEDLHQIFPPLVFNGIETRKDQRNRRRKQKQSAAMTRMEKFVLSRGIITRNKKITILEVLMEALKFIENESPAALPVPAKNLQTGLLANTQTIIPPLKHSVESMLESPMPINVVPQFDLQSFVFNFSLWNMALQNQINQMWTPVENKENANGTGTVFFSSPQQL
ncbi:hypothetical protein CAEBREN_16717 [Caenorhabditis brenneri]|uniref:Uncharacterized protein n=1 Tax=Caenorhabditis brenneri TaxID=135651 RepID=G0P683_CAEBE|nr:hypothetical protein CAEBREN_16717 [Caenorhabditis brenneri]